MKKYSTLLLKIAVFLIGLPVLAACLYILPNIIIELFTMPPKGIFLLISIFIMLSGSVSFFFIALYQAYKLLNYIEKKEAFSNLSVNALSIIKKCAFVISGFYTAGLPILYLIAQLDDAPGVILIGLIIIFASVVIGIFAALLQEILKNAIEIKSENDLTI